MFHLPKINALWREVCVIILNNSFSGRGRSVDFLHATTRVSADQMHAEEDSPRVRGILEGMHELASCPRTRRVTMGCIVTVMVARTSNCDVIFCGSAWLQREDVTCCHGLFLCFALAAGQKSGNRLYKKPSPQTL